MRRTGTGAARHVRSESRIQAEVPSSFCAYGRGSERRCRRIYRWKAFSEAIAAGTLSDEDVAALHKLHREGQWFFDFCYVENAEGAHNSALAHHCLDVAEEKIDEGMALLGAG